MFHEVVLHDIHIIIFQEIFFKWSTAIDNMKLGNMQLCSG